jgi:phage terminase large subunit-like protein
LPNLGLSIQIETLVTEMAEAEAKGVEELSIWASQHLNIEIGIALHKDRWKGVSYWLDAIDPEPITLKSILERSEVVTMGVDGGGLDDLLGLSILGRDKITKDWLSWSKAWAHPSVLKERKEIADRLRQFEREGDLVITEYPTQDIEELADVAEQIHQAGLFPEKYGIGLDAVGVAAITDEIASRGLDPELMVAVPQGYKLSGQIKGFERKLMDGTLWHDGSEMMTWCVGNARVEQRGNAVLITKQVSGTAKIDPLIGALNAFALMSRNPEAAHSAATPWDVDKNYRYTA